MRKLLSVAFQWPISNNRISEKDEARTIDGGDTVAEWLERSPYNVKSTGSSLPRQLLCLHHEQYITYNCSAPSIDAW